MTDVYCAECGQPVGASDKFCSSCGHRIGGAQSTRAPEGPSTLPPKGNRDRKKTMWLLGIGALVVAATAATLLSLGVIELGSDDSSDTATLRARLQQPLDAEMEAREDALVLEKDYREALASARDEISEYQRAFSAAKQETEAIDQEFADEFDACYQDFRVPCPEPVYPTYPGPPTVTEQVDRIRSLAGRFDRLAVDLLDLDPPADLGDLHGRLTQAVSTLQEEAQFNADILDQAVKENVYEESQLSAVKESRLRSLRLKSAAPILGSLQAEVDSVLERLEIDAAEYDIPGITPRSTDADSSAS